MFRDKCDFVKNVLDCHVISHGGYNCLATVRVTSGGNIHDTAVQMPALSIFLSSASFILIPVTYSLRMWQTLFAFTLPVPIDSEPIQRTNKETKRRPDRSVNILTFIY